MNRLSRRGTMATWRTVRGVIRRATDRTVTPGPGRRPPPQRPHGPDGTRRRKTRKPLPPLGTVNRPNRVQATNDLALEVATLVTSNPRREGRGHSRSFVSFGCYHAMPLNLWPDCREQVSGCAAGRASACLPGPDKAGQCGRTPGVGRYCVSLPTL